MNNVLTKKFYPNLTIQEFHEDSQIFIQEYSCPLCEGILNQCVIDKCGHSFCKDCVEVLIKETNKCPFTNLEIINHSKSSNQFNEMFSNLLSQNIMLNSVIEKQKVYCKNRDQNCDWIGKLLERKNHLLHDCEKELVECEFSDKCDLKFTRDQLNIHLEECPHRIILCHHCKDYVTHNKLEDHYKSCKHFPTICKCNLSVPKSNLLFHVEYQCDLTIVECPFNVVGCEFMEIRKDLKIHLNEHLEQHLKMINQKIKNLDDVVTLQKNQIINLENEKEELKIEINNTNSIIIKNQEDVANSIDNLYKNMENMKMYMNIQMSNLIPNFFNQENNFNNTNSLLNKIFKIKYDNFSITKIQENYGWYGICSENINLDFDTNFNMSNNFDKSSNNFNGLINTNKNNKNTKIIINLKIIKTLNSCIMFGITFSNSKSPMQNGFYQKTEDEDISYMIYTYNCSIYNRGRSISNVETNVMQCIEGDVISLIIDNMNNTISFRKNGNMIVEPIEVKLLSIEDYRKNLRIAVDLCDYSDEVIFLS